MKIIASLILLLSLVQLSEAQVDFNQPYCFKNPGNDSMGLIDSMYPSHLFKTEEIKEYLQQHPETPVGQFYEFHMHNYYRPNQRYFSFYNNLLQTKTSYKSLTFTEKAAILSADLVIKGRIIDFEDYSDTCVFYKSTYKVEIVEIYKDNFSFHKGDTVSLKSVVGYTGGCAQPEWPFADSIYAAPTHYERPLDRGATAVFGLSALWYYKVAVRQSIRQSKFMDASCFAHFVDPGFLLIGAMNKTQDIEEFNKSLEQ